MKVEMIKNDCIKCILEPSEISPDLLKEAGTPPSPEYGRLATVYNPKTGQTTIEWVI